jgi:hypothetical protein
MTNQQNATLASGQLDRCAMGIRLYVSRGVYRACDNRQTAGARLVIKHRLPFQVIRRQRAG